MKATLATLAFMLFAGAAEAQYRGNYGMDRRLGGAGSVPAATPKKDKKPFDYVQASVERLETELQLDALQKAVIREAVTDYYDVAMSMQAEDIPNDGKAMKMKAESEKMDKKIQEILNPDQKQKYTEIKARKLEKTKKKGKGKAKQNEQEIPDLMKLDSLMTGN